MSLSYIKTTIYCNSANFVILSWLIHKSLLCSWKGCKVLL